MKKTTILYIFVAICTLLSSCTFPTVQRAAMQQATAQSPESLMTAVALTVAANSVVTPLAGSVTLETTVQPSVPVIVESPTPKPTETQTIIPTTTPSQTLTSIPCDRAAFVTDVTVPDGSKYIPGTEFTKTWRLQNNGSCTWNTSYDLVFDSGDAMNGPTAVDLPSNVAPGQTIDLSVNLKAPASAGTYKGFWKLRNASGAVFGIGASGSNPFWVEIKAEFLVMEIAPGFTGFAFALPKYSIATNYCDAEWRSAAGVLACPGTTSDANGFVIRKDNPTISNGTALSGVAIETHPQWTNSGRINGKFPGIEIESGDHFRAQIGCLQGAESCNVDFFLYYTDESDVLHSQSWNVIAGDAPKEIDVDLSGSAGQEIRVTLSVTANGNSTQDWAIWYYPRIAK